MKVFKFGGASVKDANAVKNVCDILSLYKNEKIIVVVSAMGKTTNLLEKIIESKNNLEFEELKKQLFSFHQKIIGDLNLQKETSPIVEEA